MFGSASRLYAIVDVNDSQKLWSAQQLASSQIDSFIASVGFRQPGLHVIYT